MARLGFLMAITLLAAGAFAQNIPSDPIIYQVPEMSDVTVKQNVVYKKIHDTSLTLDVYYPPKFDHNTTLPVVIFNNGVGSLTIPLWRVYQDWGKLIAAKGMIAINYQARNNNGMQDGDDLVEYLHTNGASLGIDTSKMAIWTCSANTRVGMRLAMEASRTYIRSLANDYGEKLGVGGYLSGLCRTRIGDFLLKDALTMEEFESKINQD